MDQSLFKLLGKCATIPFVKDFTLLGSGLGFCKPVDFFTWNCSFEAEIVSFRGVKITGTCL